MNPSRETTAPAAATTKLRAHFIRALQQWLAYLGHLRHSLRSRRIHHGQNTETSLPHLGQSPDEGQISFAPAAGCRQLTNGSSQPERPSVADERTPAQEQQEQRETEAVPIAIPASPAVDDNAPANPSRLNARDAFPDEPEAEPAHAPADASAECVAATADRPFLASTGDVAAAEPADEHSFEAAPNGLVTASDPATVIDEPASEMLRAASTEELLNPTKPPAKDENPDELTPASSHLASGPPLPSPEPDHRRLDHLVSTSDAASDPIPFEPAVKPAQAARPPGRYRPRLDRAERNDNAVQAKRGESAERERLTLEAELQITFAPGAWGLSPALLFRRNNEMADQLTVRIGAEDHVLESIADDLFEPIPMADFSSVLATGIAAEAAEPQRARWVRTGRTLHAFTARTGIAGFISVPRVVIGQENAVLCAEPLAADVIAVAKAVGSPDPEEISGPGVPDGWRCFRRIHPAVADVPDGCEGLFLALVPLPQAAIELGGGLAIDRSAWLLGYPPSIRIVGAVAAPGDVTIDGLPASVDTQAGCSAPGWDSEGTHTVTYKGISRRYEIARGLQEWDVWPAYQANGLRVCGALTTNDAGHPVFVTDRRTYLVGEFPGEIAEAAPPILADTSLGVAAPQFQPVWAVQPASARRQSQPPVLIRVPQQSQSHRTRKPRSAVRLWCQAFRDARFASSLASYNQQASELWQQYRRNARTLWRRVR